MAEFFRKKKKVCQMCAGKSVSGVQGPDRPYLLATLPSQ